MFLLFFNLFILFCDFLPKAGSRHLFFSSFSSVIHCRRHFPAICFFLNSLLRFTAEGRFPQSVLSTFSSAVHYRRRVPATYSFLHSLVRLTAEGRFLTLLLFLILFYGSLPKAGSRHIFISCSHLIFCYKISRIIHKIVAPAGSL